jgi:hypothetical protein
VRLFAQSATEFSLAGVNVDDEHFAAAVALSLDGTARLRAISHQLW